MTFSLYPYVTDTSSNEVLITLLASFTIIYYILRLVASNILKGSGDIRSALIYEFYGKNPTSAYLMDLLFIVSYFAVTIGIYQTGIFTQWLATPVLRFFVILVCVIIVLNIIVKFIADAMVGTRPSAHYIQFFYKWGNAMGFWAMVWDCIYLGIIAILAFTLISFGLHNKIWITAGFWLAVTYYFLTISE